MEGVASSAYAEAIIETLKTRGWCVGDLDQVKTLVVLFKALSDDLDLCSIANKVESELINTDLRSFGGISLPESNIRKSSYILGPRVLQISSVRDISKSSIAEFSGNSSGSRLLRLGLTDGHSEITAIEFTHVPAIADDVVPGTKIRLENKVMIKGGILCLNPKVITVLGGVVQSLYDEWKMNKKYSGVSRLSKESGTCGPPPFEKLQIEPPSRSRFAQPGRSHEFSESTSKRAGPIVASSVGNAESRWSRKSQNAEVKPDNVDNGLKTTSIAEKLEENPSSSETRAKEVVESVPVQNQAAAQKLLQKMGHSNQDGRHSRGRNYRGKGKQEEPVVFTLDEWEKRNVGAKPQINEYPETSRDEDLARQLQAQLDMEEYNAQRTHDAEADYIKRSMFNYGGEDGRDIDERGGRERGRGRAFLHQHRKPPSIGCLASPSLINPILKHTSQIEEAATTGPIATISDWALRDKRWRLQPSTQSHFLHTSENGSDRRDRGIGKHKLSCVIPILHKLIGKSIAGNLTRTGQAKSIPEGVLPV
ncbi:transmembrane protein 19-like [Hibiscus syriacus]|uniref:Transmembrane protein 19-like n=1 Tax=Hibiscus syriacus TaxID=106335 RepID=A0A6A2Y3T1_HIBSY|nr:transmembrane protein 19-like [Hibiscus syriacus]